MLIHSSRSSRFGPHRVRGVVLFVGRAQSRWSACRVVPAGETLVHQERSAWQTIVVVDERICADAYASVQGRAA
jgi:hypothetical protein